MNREPSLLASLLEMMLAVKMEEIHGLFDPVLERWYCPHIDWAMSESIEMSLGFPQTMTLCLFLMAY